LLFFLKGPLLKSNRTACRSWYVCEPKCGWQMEMRVMGDKEGFDEGADHIDFARWTSKPPRR
jgi:hypothetical protein